MSRRLVRRSLIRRLSQRAVQLDESELMQQAIVFAPHPDDETLGCGGFVALKRAAGVDVSIVFLTDGAGSHSKVAKSELARRRRCEAVAAAGTLGVQEDHLHFLDSPDGQVAAFREPLGRAIGDILDSTAATQLIVPHPSEPPSDHHQTYEVVAAAASLQTRRFHALLYPIWIWDQWPWTDPRGVPRGRMSRGQALRMSLQYRLGWGLTQELSRKVDISPTLACKRLALEAHSSQMARPADQPDWLTLADVSNGEWLDLLLQSEEFFSETHLGGHCS